MDKSSKERWRIRHTERHFDSNLLIEYSFNYFYCRFVIAFIYYGLTLHIGKLGGNLYVNFTVSCVMEFAGYFLCIFMDRTGRKPMHLTVMFLSGISCLVSVLPLMFGNDCNFKGGVSIRSFCGPSWIGMKIWYIIEQCLSYPKLNILTLLHFFRSRDTWKFTIDIYLFFYRGHSLI